MKLTAVLVVLITTALWLQGSDVVPVNSWSAQYMKYAMDPGQASNHLPLPPRSHKRAGLWLARDALRAGDLTYAATLVDEAVLRGDADALRIQGAILERQGDFEGAIEAWVKAGDDERLVDAGVLAAADGRLGDAHLAYSAMASIEPERGALLLASFLWRTGRDPAEAEAFLRDALAEYSISQYRSLWRRELGELLHYQQRWGEAQATYLEAIRDDPNDWSAHIGLGWVYYKRDRDLESAMTQFRKAISLDPGQGDGYFAIGDALGREDRFAEADNWLAQALRLNPDARWWYVGRANVARNAGNYALAMEIYLDAIARYPDFGQAHYELAWAFRMAGLPEGAIDAITKALEMMSLPDESYYLRAGKILEWVGEIDRSLAAYRQVLAINPLNQSALEGLTRLGQ